MRFFCVRNKINANFLYLPQSCTGVCEITSKNMFFLNFLKNLKCRHSKAEKGGAKNKKSGVLFFSSKKCTFGTPQPRAQCPKKCVRKLKKRVRFWAHYWGAVYRESVKHQVPKSDVLKKCIFGNSHKCDWNLVKMLKKSDFNKKTLRLTMVFVFFFSAFCAPSDRVLCSSLRVLSENTNVRSQAGQWFVDALKCGKKAQSP